MKKIALLLTLLLSSVGVILADNASFPGGEEALEKYISANLKYPATAAENGIEGVVQVSFTVKADGSIGTIKIDRMVDPDLEQEAIRLVKSMPVWIPATGNGTPIDSRQTLKIPFTLNN